MADIKVTITEQSNPSVLINTLESQSLGGQITSNDAELSLLLAATGALSTATGELSAATGTLTGATGALSTATGAISAALNDPTGALPSSLNSLSGNLTGFFTTALTDLSGTFTGTTGEFAQTGKAASFSTLDVTGQSQFDKKVKVTPNDGTALHAHSSGTNNSAVRIRCEGPVVVGHDLFQKAGFSGGFGDNSNHFHSLIDINRIEQQPEGDVKNIERVEEKYYAIQNNNLPNSKAAFWEWHKVARKLGVSTVDTSTATLDVSALQNSSNRVSDSEAFFSLNTTPSGKSEELTITLNGHSISGGDNIRMTFDQSFEGPIVAASLFGKVTSITTNTFNVELYGGNYKTTSQVPLGTDQTALTFDNVILESIGTNSIVQNGNETNLQHYSKTNFTPNRLKDETLKATWSVAHGLVKNEHCTLITNGDGGLDIQQSAYVLDPDPDGDNLSVILVYGRKVQQFNLASFTSFGSTNWTLHKGSIDGIHNETVGDNLFSFNANNVGEYNSYQIGPGSQVDADCISIGKNVYNSEASTIKIGYENEMLNIGTGGIDVTGSITSSGIIKSASYEPGDFPDTTSVRTTAAFKEDGTMVQDSKVIVKKITGAEAKAMSFGTLSSWIEMIPAPGANKVIVVRDVEVFIDRGTWTPMHGGQVRGWGGDLQLVIETPALTNGGVGEDTFDYNTYAVLQKKFLNHTINNVYVAASAVDTIIVRDTPVTQTRAYANVPLLLRPKSAVTTSQLTTYSHTPDDDYYFRITYKIMDMSSDFTPTTT